MIGSFDDLHKKRKKQDGNIEKGEDLEKEYEKLWNDFYRKTIK